MTRKTILTLLGTVAFTLFAEACAQEPKRITVVMDYESCDGFRDRLRATPASHEDFQKAVCANLHKLFPAWKFQASDLPPLFDFPQIKLKFRGEATTISQLSVDVRVDLRRDDEDSPSTVLRWVNLFPSGAVATSFNDLGAATCDRLVERLSDERDGAREVVQIVPVSDGFVECHARLRAVLPLTWAEFKRWSFSHFRAEFANPATLVLKSEAIGRPHKSFISVQHTKVKKVGHSERDVDETQDDFRPFQIGSIYVDQLRRNDNPDASEAIINRN